MRESVPTVTGSDDGGTTTAIITGAVVAFVIIVVTIAIVVIVFLVLKSRRGALSLKKSDGMYVDIVHFIFYLSSSYTVHIESVSLSLRYESTVVGKAVITTSANEAYGMVKTGGAAGDEGYEMVDISPATEMCKVRLSPNQPLPPPPSSPPPPPPSPPHPPGPSPALAGAEDEVVYDFIP